MLETSYTLNFKQLFKIVIELKKNLWQKLKLEKTQNLNRATTSKQVGFLIPEVEITPIAIIIWQLFKYRLGRIQ